MLGGCVVGGGVVLPLGEVFDPMTTPAHPLLTIEAATTSAISHFRALPVSDL